MGGERICDPYSRIRKIVREHPISRPYLGAAKILGTDPALSRIICYKVSARLISEIKRFITYLGLMGVESGQRGRKHTLI